MSHRIQIPWCKVGVGFVVLSRYPRSRYKYFELQPKVPKRLENGHSSGFTTFGEKSFLGNLAGTTIPAMMPNEQRTI